MVSWWNLWGSLCRVSYPLQIKTVLFFTCQFECLLFLLLIWLLWLGLPSSTMLNKRGESGHPCLVLDLKWNTCSFWVLSMMLAVGLSYMAFIMFRYVPTYSTLLRVFIINQCWILPNAFSASIDIHLFLSFILFMWSITFIDCECCSVLTFPEWTPLDHGVWYFWCIAVFSLLIFCWGF